jgi:hypothetical protein
LIDSTARAECRGAIACPRAALIVTETVHVQGVARLRFEDGALRTPARRKTGHVVAAGLP